MSGFGYVCALLLAAVFIRAAGAKLARPAVVGSGFDALGLPAPRVLARVVPLVELALAAALAAAPRVGGIAAIGALSAFTAFLVRALARGVTAGCNCFGTARAEPLSPADLGRNGVLLGYAAAAVTESAPVVPTPAAATLAVAVGMAALAGLRLARRRR